MKPYGNTRADNLTCLHGCCGTGRCRGRQGYNVLRAFRRAGAGRARAQGKQLARLEAEER